jgi:hypothetical protein
MKAISEDLKFGIRLLCVNTPSAIEVSNPCAFCGMLSRPDGHFLSSYFVHDPKQGSILPENYDNDYPPITRFLSNFSEETECQPPKIYVGCNDWVKIQGLSSCWYCATILRGDTTRNNSKEKHLTNWTNIMTLFKSDADEAGKKMFIELPKLTLVGLRMMRMVNLYSTPNFDKGIASFAGEFTLNRSIDSERKK